MIHKIKYRLLIFILAVTLLPNILILNVLLNKTASFINKQLSYSIQNNLYDLSKRMDGILKDIELLEANLATDNYFIQVISSRPEENTAYQNYQNNYYINGRIRALAQTNPNIQSIFVYDEKNRRLFSSVMTGYINEEQLEETGWYQWMTEDEKDSIWRNRKEFSPFEMSIPSIRYTITLKKEIIANNGGILTLYFNVSENTFRKYIDDVKLSSQGYIAVMSQEGVIISDPAKENIGTKNYSNIMKNDEDNSIGNVKNDNFLITYCTSGYNHWNYVAFVPKKILFAEMNNIRILTYAVCIFIEILVLLFTGYVYRSIYLPIQRLIEQMEKNRKGTMSANADENRKDEFGVLNRSFNQMIIGMDKLTKELYQQDTLRKEAEIKLLQSQMNPHFLYNVLDMIHWIARIRKVDEIADISFAMSSYYRLSLSEGKDILTVKEVIELAKHYLDIQRIRFHENLDIIINVEKDAEGCEIPKLLIQPILENSIKHGIEKKKEKGLIHIEVKKIEDLLEIVILDNGIGIPEEKLSQLVMEICTGDFEKKGNYALKNANCQIKLLYGVQYGLDIESTYGEGTTVRMQLPIKEKNR